MKLFVFFSVCLSFLFLVSGLSLALEIAFEAEAADTIEAPMVIGVPADGSANGGTDAPDPSRGEFIWVPGKPLEGGPNGNKGFAQYKIDIPQAGTYAIWARVIAWDGNSDSFWVVWEPADTFENPQETDNKDFRWSVAQGNEWHWDRIEAWLADGSHVDREWTVPAGPTTLTIFCREDATMLDTLFITDNLSSDEAEVNPQLPTEANPTAVQPDGKVAVTWGEIRSR